MGKGADQGFRVWSEVMAPYKTQFIELFGKQVEFSELQCRIPEASALLQEISPTPPELGAALVAEGIQGADETRTVWELTFEMPAVISDGPDQLSVTLNRFSRSSALSDGARFQDFVLGGNSFEDEVNAQVISYPSDDLICPAMLWADFELPGVGQVSLSASADDFSTALKLMQSLAPGVRFNS